ncbi:putative outer membrane lipoprotein [Aquimixticola soesokkakensis]|uniref:Putative outer membrane lipoprotein n=1 Tax=Aquimixticola soesokkakensis TaxID=1519096 RepID=A0A1Y5SZ18_9RHOB|nr:OmpA family protein [Aquimixticola soesokkakensis]SLN51995.1 putative outer membrane lipoprotein [Aquimixticola soesokkakensis]
MTRTRLRSTTSTLLILSMAVPAPLLAQNIDAASAAAIEQELQTCAEVEPPCLTEDGMVMLLDGTTATPAEALDALGVALDPAAALTQAEGTDGAAEAEGQAEGQAAGQAAPAPEAAPAAEAAADPVPEAQPEVAPEAQPDATPEAQAAQTLDDAMASDAVDAQGTAETAAEPAPAEQSPAEAAEPMVDVGGAAKSDVVTPEEMTEPQEQPAQSEADTQALEDALAAEAEADTAAQSEMTTPEQPAEAEAAPQADAAPQDAAPQAAAETPADQAPANDAAANDTAAGEKTQAEMAAETPADAQALTEEELAAQAQAEADAQAASQEQPAAAAAANGEAEGETNVTDTVVNAEDVRTSDEDFTTSASGDVSAQAQGEAASESKNKGFFGNLSSTEKLLLGAAGVIAVGTILNNGDKVVSNSGDRMVVDRDGRLVVLKNDDTLIAQPGNEVRTETFSDGSSRTIVARDDGSQVITIRTADGQVLRRTRVLADGREVVLFDDTQTYEPVDVSTLPVVTRAPAVTYDTSEEALRAALAQAEETQFDRAYSLSQIRNIRAVRDLAPEVALENVTFASGSAAISPSEAEELSSLGRAMAARIAENPQEVFLIEGHTDAVGNATYNLALSDRRAESLALALTEYFDVPPENMVVQGYGEQYLKVRTAAAERENRRTGVRVITPLLGEAVASSQ